MQKYDFFLNWKKKNVQSEKKSYFGSLNDLVAEAPDSASFARRFLLCHGLVAYYLGCVAKFGEALRHLIGCGLLGIVGDGDGLFFNACLHHLDAFLEAQVVLDFVFAAGAVHLWGGGDHHLS